VLLVQFPWLLTMVTQGQWNALRHGHFGYYSLTALTGLLDSAGMSVATAWEFDLYGGTILAAAVHGRVEPDDRANDILEREWEFGVTEPAVVGRLQQTAERHATRLRNWLVAQADSGRTIYGYGAGSRVPALFSIAKIDRQLLPAVADAAPGKQGRRIPGTDIPIVSPEELIKADPDGVMLTLPDLYDEVRRSFPQFEGRWSIDPGADGNGQSP
jgi:hypothetical protein